MRRLKTVVTYDVKYVSTHFDSRFSFLGTIVDLGRCWEIEQSEQLGRSLHRLGRLDRAEVIYERALQGYKRRIGKLDKTRLSS
jgi:hypothetical protein